MKKNYLILAIVAVAMLVAPIASAGFLKNVANNSARILLTGPKVLAQAADNTLDTSKNIISPFREKPLKALICAPIVVPLKVLAGAGDIVHDARQGAFDGAESVGRAVTNQEAICINDVGALNEAVTDANLDVWVDAAALGVAVGVPIHNQSQHHAGKAVAWAVGGVVAADIAPDVVEAIEN